MEQMTAQVHTERSPFSVRCVHCGAETSYDLARRNYHCLFCGGVTAIDEAPAQASAWQARQQRRVREALWESAPALRLCPGCGAATLASAPDGGPCLFCGAEPQRAALSRDMDVPALALPFVLTQQEALQTLKSWLGRKRLHKEARRIAKAAERLEPCFLPCHLLQGPVSFQVSRRACQRQYRCESFAKDVLVNSSAQVDSLLLSAVEPFDWSRLQPFSPALLQQGRVKLRDLPEALLERRIDEELALHHLAAVEQELRCSDLQLEPERDQALCLPVLAPVYLLNLEDCQLLINGQTGRIAVRRDKPQRSREWLLEPLILSLLAALFWMYAAAGNLELFILATGASVVLIFALLGGERGERLHRRLFRIRDPLAERCEGRFFLSPPQSEPEREAVQLRFCESLDGESTPVDFGYYTPKRLALFALFALSVLALPWLLTLLLTALRMLFGAPVHVREIEAAYGAVWYVLAAAGLFLGCLSLGRSLLFDHPILWRRLPDGRRVRVPAAQSAPGRLSLWARLRRFLRADAIVGLGLGLLLVLIGSILAMLP